MLTNQPSIKQHLIISKHYPNLAVWFVKHNWQTLHERRDYLPPKRIVTRNTAQDSPETVNVVWTRVPALACFSGGRMPSFHSPLTHTNTSCLFRRKTRSFSRPLSVKLAFVSSAERFACGSLWWSFPWSVRWRCSRPGGVLLLPVYWRLRLEVISEEEETLLEQLFEHHNHLKVDKERHLLSNGRYDASALVGDVKKFLRNIYFNVT